MNEHNISSESSTAPEPRWQPLGRIERRVLGVLAEKAKTTPEAYPLSLNALVNGCNQKSNRSPQMQLDGDGVEEALERLRTIGAIRVLQGDGRVDKYRHMLYEWLGVDKVELAVMAELMLRGEQTIGQLRGRAARMEPIAGLAELQPVLDSLHAKRLLIYLTPKGRGCMVTHNLYQPQELDKLRAGLGAELTDTPPAPACDIAPKPTPPPAATPAPSSELASLREEVTAVKEQLAQLCAELEALKESLGE